MFHSVRCFDRHISVRKKLQIERLRSAACDGRDLGGLENLLGDLIECHLSIAPITDALSVKEFGVFELGRGSNFCHHLSKSGLLCCIGSCLRGALRIIGNVGRGIAEKIRANFGSGDGEKWKHGF